MKNPTRISLAIFCLLASCCGGEPDQKPGSADTKITNRLPVPPEVVANLGITFEKATRGRVGVWVTVPGELYVPSTHRWTLRSPARGRIKQIVPAWTAVKKGDVVAELMVPELMQMQQTILDALSCEQYAEEVFQSATDRLTEAETLVKTAKEVEKAAREQLEKLQKLGDSLSPKQILEARRRCADAEMAALEASVRRDELCVAARNKDLARAQARMRCKQEVSALSVLTGFTIDELVKKDGDAAVWKSLAVIQLRAPAGGTVVDVAVSQHTAVEEGAHIADIIDPIELRFRGWVPEGDLKLLSSGLTVRVDLPGGLLTVRTTLLGPMPIADSTTRRLLIEATVPNPRRTLPEGLSATAHVKTHESKNLEVLLPEDCIVMDGLETIVFRRDPGDLNSVIRTPVELGLRGAGQVEVLAGVLDGDFVVRNGIYQLKKTGLGKAPEGGHFHVDGTWHKEHD